MKISIITVVKNDKKNLIISLKSVLSQKLSNYQYIIFDGMSNDGTDKIIKKYINDKIHYIRKKDKSYYDGLNQAIKIAKGNYIGILNAGDQYADNMTLNYILNKILLSNCDFLFGNLNFLNQVGKINRIWRYPVNKLNKFTALKIASPTLFVRKRILLKNPYNLSYFISADTDFNLKLSKNNYNFLYLDKILILMKSGGLSTNPKYFFIKMKEDLKLLFYHFKFVAPIIYFYKLVIKFFSLKFLLRK